MANKASSSYRETILIDEEYFSALLAAIDAAKNSIDLETYIYKEDVFGIRVANALCRAAKRGVKVRVLVDGIGTRNWGDQLTKKIEKAGVETRIFHPLPWRTRRWLYSILNIDKRNHRKSCVIDKNIVFVGSSNIERYHVMDNGKKILLRNTSVKLENVNAKDLQYAFEKAWNHIDLKTRWRHYIRRINMDPVFRLNYSVRLRFGLYRSQLKRMRACRERIWITNAYFVANYLLLNRLRNAAKRGVDVRILLPSEDELAPMRLVTETFYSYLLDAGISIYEYSPCILHAKSLILDKWFSVGSSNLNYRSFLHDLEVDVHVHTPRAMKRLEEQYLEDLQQSHKITRRDVKDIPWYKKVIGHVFLLFRYWL